MCIPDCINRWLSFCYFIVIEIVFVYLIKWFLVYWQDPSGQTQAQIITSGDFWVPDGQWWLAFVISLAIMLVLFIIYWLISLVWDGAYSVGRDTCGVMCPTCRDVCCRDLTEDVRELQAENRRSAEILRSSQTEMERYRMEMERRMNNTNTAVPMPPPYRGVMSQQPVPANLFSS
jgi:hypothetical protein